MDRKSDMKERLRAKLRQRKAALAEEFDYLLFYIIYYNSQPPEIYQAEKVGLSMTNNQEQVIMQGVEAQIYSKEEAQSLLNKDTVQVHAARWHSLCPKSLGTIDNISLQIWPSNVSRLELLCYSRWKKPLEGAQSGYKLLNIRFSLTQDTDIGRNIIPFLARAVNSGNKGLVDKKSGGIIFNKAQNFGVWVTPNTENNLLFSMSSTMICIQQDHLTSWHPDADELPSYHATFDFIMQTMHLLEKTAPEDAKI